MVVSCQLHTTAALPQGNNTGTHCRGGWVGPTGLDILEKRKDSCPLPGSEPRIDQPVA